LLFDECPELSAYSAETTVTNDPGWKPDQKYALLRGAKLHSEE
jgi:hypothetical protein